MGAELDGRPIVGGQRVDTGTTSEEVRDPYRGDVVGIIQQPSLDLVADAVRAARDAQPEVAALPIHARADILRRASTIIGERRDEIARTVTRQTGKTLKDTLREADRSRNTLRSLATAVEAETGEVVDGSVVPGGEGLMALVVREPLGVVAAIAPFNAPFNLSMHKVAAAIAGGNSVVLKPSSYAPFSGLQLADVFIEAGLPAGAIGVLPGSGIGQRLAANDDVDAISFTGSVPVGRALARDAGLKRVVLELGGNSPNIVHGDADIERAAAAIVAGGFSNTGQSCNSVQRVIAHRSIVDELSARLAMATDALVVGDPLDPATEVGTLVDLAAAERVESWIEEAVAAGARVASGGNREGAQLTPTVLVDVVPTMRICREEVFGPVVNVLPYDHLDEAIAIGNATPFGLQAAVFTASLKVALAAARRLRAGGVMVNRSSNTRLDNLPFGGWGDSGLGREGGRYSLREMTREKLILLDTGGA